MTADDKAREPSEATKAVVWPLLNATCERALVVMSPATFALFASAWARDRASAEQAGRDEGIAIMQAHYHVAGTTVGKHIDECAQCGRDLRDRVHSQDYIDRQRAIRARKAEKETTT